MSLMDVAGELEQLTTIEALWPEIVKALAEEGLGAVIYLTVDADLQSPHLLTTLPELFAESDPSSDPFLEYCCHSYEPTFTGAAFLPRYDYLPEAARSFIQRAEAAGFSAGLAIPVRLTGSSRFGGFNLGTGLEAEAFETRFAPKTAQLRMFCLLMHRRLEEMLVGEAVFEHGFRRRMVAGGRNGVSRLTPRESEVLFLLAHGMSRKECARTCGISPHTVSDYTKSIYRKLKVRNIVEAAQVGKMI